MPRSRRRRRTSGRPTTTVRLDPPSALSAGEKIEHERLQRVREWRRRRRWAFGLMALGAMVGVTHLGEHFGLYTLYRSGADDLLAGYPMAGLLVVAGAMRLPAH